MPPPCLASWASIGPAIATTPRIPEYRDSGVRHEQPGPWPRVDAELIAAAALIPSCDNALQSLHEQNEWDADERDDYLEIDNRRVEALDTLAEEPAQSVFGIRAKAEAIKALPGTDYEAILAIAAPWRKTPARAGRRPCRLTPAMGRKGGA